MPAPCQATVLCVVSASRAVTSWARDAFGAGVFDMEGVSGVVKWEEVEGGESLYEEARRLYTEEINAAVRGARAAGATEIVVMDCHGAGKGWTFNSLLPELLDPGCEWVVQDEWSEYTEFLEQGCDAALLIAMHAKAGSERGVMSHTISGHDYRDLRFNGVSGETSSSRRNDVTPTRWRRASTT